MDRPCPSQQGCTPLPTVSCDLRAQESLCERDLGTSRGAVGLGRKVVGEQRFFPPWRQGSASSLTDPRRKHRGTRLCPSRQRRAGQGAWQTRGWPSPDGVRVCQGAQCRAAQRAVGALVL